MRQDIYPHMIRRHILPRAFAATDARLCLEHHSLNHRKVGAILQRELGAHPSYFPRLGIRRYIADLLYLVRDECECLQRRRSLRSEEFLRMVPLHCQSPIPSSVAETWGRLKDLPRPETHCRRLVEDQPRIPREQLPLPSPWVVSQRRCTPHIGSSKVV